MGEEQNRVFYEYFLKILEIQNPSKLVEVSSIKLSDQSELNGNADIIQISKNEILLGIYYSQFLYKFFIQNQNKFPNKYSVEVECQLPLPESFQSMASCAKGILIGFTDKTVRLFNSNPSATRPLNEVTKLQLEFIPRLLLWVPSRRLCLANNYEGFELVPISLTEDTSLTDGTGLTEDTSQTEGTSLSLHIERAFTADRETWLHCWALLHDESVQEEAEFVQTPLDGTQQHTDAVLALRLDLALFNCKSNSLSLASFL